MQLRPLHDRVIVKAVPKEEKTKSGLFLAGTPDKGYEEGKVTAVGPGRLLENGTRAAMSLKVGDKIIYSGYSHQKVKIDDVESVIVSESEVIAVIE